MGASRRVLWAVAVPVALAACGCGGHSSSQRDAAADANGPGDDGPGNDRPAVSDASGDADLDAGPVTDAPIMDAPDDPWFRPESIQFDGAVIGGDDACNTLSNTAATITPTTEPRNAPIPDLHGGAIADGRYELISVDFFPPGNGASPVSVYRRTTEFQQGARQWLWVDLGAPDAGQWVTQRYSFAVSAPDAGVLSIANGCSGGGTNQYAYEAVPNGLTVWIPTSRLLERYLAVP